MQTAITQEALKSSPPVAVTAVAVANGMTLNEWVAIGTLIYIGLQAGYLVWKWWKEARRAKR